MREVCPREDGSDVLGTAQYRWLWGWFHNLAGITLVDAEDEKSSVDVGTLIAVIGDSMVKADYDSDDDGTVDSADVAANALALDSHTADEFLLAPAADNGAIIARLAGVWTYLAAGSIGTVLTVDGDELPSWSALPVAADDTAGIVELATAAETTAGTEDAKAITPAGLAASAAGKRLLDFQWVGPSEALTIGDGKIYYRVPPESDGFSVTSPGAHVAAASSAELPTFQLRRVRAGVPHDLLTTLITIDVGEKDSADATTAPVLDADVVVQTGDEIWVDVDVAGTDVEGPSVQCALQLL